MAVSGGPSISVEDKDLDSLGRRDTLLEVFGQ